MVHARPPAGSSGRALAFMFTACRSCSQDASSASGMSASTLAPPLTRCPTLTLQIGFSGQQDIHARTELDEPYALAARDVFAFAE